MATRTLAISPTKYRANIGSNLRILQFRHPWVNEGQSGLVRSVGIAKLDESARIALLAQANRLLETAPKLKQHAPPGTDPRLLSVYFDALDEVLNPSDANLNDPLFPVIIDRVTGLQYSLTPPDAVIKRDKRGKIKSWSYRQDPELYQFIMKVKEHVDNLKGIFEAEKLGYERKIEDLQITLKELEWRLAERSKREQSTTILDCWRHFKKHFKVRSSEDAQYFVMKRVRKILKKIGPQTTFSQLTESKIENAVMATKPRSAGEEQKRRQAIKRFFRFICRPAQANGLGFPIDPAAAMYVGSPQKIARQRRNLGLIIETDPRPLVADERIPIYWRAMFGVMGFAGLRLSEACALKWSDVDFNAKLIHVRANEVKDGKKTDASVRVVPPFSNVWPLLEELRREDKRSDFLFYWIDRRLPPDKQVVDTWFRIRRGIPRAESVTNAIISIIKPLNYDTKEPAQRLRRWWATTMKAHGFAEHESLLGGHTKQVSEDHYTVSERIARSLQMPTL